MNYSSRGSLGGVDLGDAERPFVIHPRTRQPQDRAILIRVAYARHFDASAVVARCVDSLGDISPRLLLVFCGGKHDPEAILAEFLAAYGTVPIVGGSAAGAIGWEGCGYSGLEVGVVAFLGADALPRLCATLDLEADEHRAGEALGRQVAAVAADGAVVLMFYDSVAASAPVRLHPASTIVDGFQAGLGSRTVKLIGGGLLTDLNLSDSWLFDGAAIRKHAAIALVFPPGIWADTVVLHGCRPVSTFMEITRIEGAEVFELDGRPALGVIEDMLGPLLDGQDLSLLATLGEKQGDPFAPYDENAYVNRLIVSSDRARGSVTLFEPDFRLGTRVQVMGRDNALMLDSVRSGVGAANAAIRRDRPFLALYIDCAGRASARSGAQEEEAEIIRSSLDRSVPLLGFYSGVEIAPFGPRSRPFDWTGVLVTLGSRA